MGGEGGVANRAACAALRAASVFRFVASACSMRSFACCRIRFLAAAASSFGTDGMALSAEDGTRTNSSVSILVTGDKIDFLSLPNATGRGLVVKSGDPSPSAYRIPSMPGRPPVLPLKGTDKKHKQYQYYQRGKMGFTKKISSTYRLTGLEPLPP